MSPKEMDETIGRLFREHKETVEQRLRTTERVKQVADALRKLSEAINRRPDFDAVSKDSILQEYLDLSKIGALVIEEAELQQKQIAYEERLRALGYDT